MCTGGFPEPFTFGVRASRHFRRFRPAYDIVHDNQCLSYGVLALQSLGYPLVTTIHHPVTIDRQTELLQGIGDAGNWELGTVPFLAEINREINRTVPIIFLEPGMLPSREHPHHLLRDFPLVQEHPEHLVPEDGLQFFQLQGRGDAEHAAITIKTAVGHQDVAVWIESEK